MTKFLINGKMLIKNNIRNFLKYNFRFDERTRESTAYIQSEMLKRRMITIFVGVLLFYWLVFFNKAHQPPPGYVMYQDKETGEIMLVHHSKLAELEARDNPKPREPRPSNRRVYDEREHKRMQNDYIANKNVYNQGPPATKTSGLTPNEFKIKDKPVNKSNNPFHDGERRYNMNLSEKQKGNDYVDLNLTELTKKGVFK